ncbi:hypothetical protein O3M35_003203 [Rhynocoris fuscipes]|uniref:Uncharacterized protein n=1 Tax=Rhynocoris fuscipes TaxID=488301 RepID=A0AAW1CQS9_9HEMI
MNEEKINTMNNMILGKREETEKQISSRYNKLKEKLDLLKVAFQNDSATNEMLEEEYASLNHLSAHLSGKMSNMNGECKRKQKELVAMECKIDELKTRQNQAQNVLAKENMTINLLCSRMKLHKEKMDEFWNLENAQDQLKNLNMKKNLLEANKTQLEEKIETLKSKIMERKQGMQKLEEEIMILKKRNAAYLKRMQRKVEYLEQILESKKKTANFSLFKS